MYKLFFAVCFVFLGCVEASGEPVVLVPKAPPADVSVPANPHSSDAVMPDPVMPVEHKVGMPTWAKWAGGGVLGLLGVVTAGLVVVKTGLWAKITDGSDNQKLPQNIERKLVNFQRGEERLQPLVDYAKKILLPFKKSQHLEQLANWVMEDLKNAYEDSFDFTNIPARVFEVSAQYYVLQDTADKIDPYSPGFLRNKIAGFYVLQGAGLGEEYLNIPPEDNLAAFCILQAGEHAQQDLEDYRDNIKDKDFQGVLRGLSLDQQRVVGYACAEMPLSAFLKLYKDPFFDDSGEIQNAGDINEKSKKLLELAKGFD